VTAYQRLDPHVDIGAYVLGVLDETDMDRFEHHLAVCGVCSARLDEFSVLVPMLGELGQAGVPEPPGAAMLDRLLDEVAEASRKRRRKRWLTTAGASALIVAGPAAAVLSMQPGPPPPAVVQPFDMQRTVSDAHTKVSATIGLTRTPWGSKVDLKLSGLYGPRTCRLLIVAKDNWTVPTTGYGTDDQPKPLNLSGATAMAPTDVAHIDVVTTKGEHLLTIPG
jgi:hypothetical protein